MRSHLALAVTFALPLLAASPAAASPISYAFTGTLSAPSNDSNQFSGIVTFEANPPLSGYGVNWPPTNPIAPDDAQVSLLSEPADITLNVGGQTFQFSNQDPNTTLSQLSIDGFSYGKTATSPTPDPPTDRITINASDQVVNFGIMSSHVYSSQESIADLRTLDFIPDFSFASLSYTSSDGESYKGTGTITSFTLIETPTPEPSTWLVALLAGGAAALRLRRSA